MNLNAMQISHFPKSCRVFHHFGQAKFPDGSLVLGYPIFNTAPAAFKNNA